MTKTNVREPDPVESHWRESIRAIKSDLEPLFERAEREDLWFLFKLDGTTLLPPAQLRRSLEFREHLYPSSAWELVDPTVKLKKMNEIITEMVRQRDRLWGAIKANRKPREQNADPNARLARF